LPGLQFRECLRQASLSDDQIRALERNRNLLMCTAHLQRVSRVR
jgi:hypothetical protein